MLQQLDIECSGRTTRNLRPELSEIFKVCDVNAASTTSAQWLVLLGLCIF